MKHCPECSTTKPVSEFYAHPLTADKLLGICKGCHRARMVKRRRENPAVQAYDRERSKLPHRRALGAANTKRYRANNPEAYKAQTAVNNAIRDGKLQRGEICEAEGCGATNGLHAHHDDYSKPLAVRWLCALHHHRGHHEHD